MRRDLYDFVMSQITYDGRCWLWNGSVNENGYGRIVTEKPKKEYVHRLVYQWAFGPIPDGKTLLHACDRPRCVNPAHLRPGTQSENVADMHAKGRRKYTRRTHCKHGHEFTPENTRYHCSGYQRCRECENAPRRKVR